MKEAATAFRKSTVVILVTVGLALGLQSAVSGQGVQCPAGGQKFNRSGSVGGVNFQASGTTLSMTNTTGGTVTVTWCAKGGEKFSNGSHISGVRSTTIPAGQTRSSSFNQDVSNFVVYSVQGGGGGGGPPPPPPPPPPPNGEPGIPPSPPGGGPGEPFAGPAPAIPGEPSVTG